MAARDSQHLSGIMLMIGAYAMFSLLDASAKFLLGQLNPATIVFMRYVIRQPDAMVTEATALLLVPLAFLGLPYALKENAFPRVTFLAERLSRRHGVMLEKLNLAVEAFVGAFFAAVSVNSTRSSFRSGASSSVLAWPEYLFWAPVAVASIVLVMYALYRLLAENPVASSGE
jgi:TRAP-type C4-dicarboxylate transport system permease small subunit